MASSPLRNRPRGYETIIVDVIFMLLAIIAVSLRLWARRLKRTNLGSSDYAILTALFFIQGLLVVQILAVTNGGEGQHQNEISKSEIEFMFKIFVAAEPFWVAACSAVKMSILCLYLSIFPNRRFRDVTYSTMGLVTCYCLGFILRTFLICRPIEYNWDKTIHGTCGDEKKSSIAGGISNMVLDIIVIILPMPMIWRLQMATNKKAIISGIFGLGIFICIISVLRLVEIIHLNYKDLTYSVVLDGIWSFLEPSLGIVNACLPVLQPVPTQLSSFSVLTRMKEISSGRSTGRRKLWSGSPSKGEAIAAKDSRKFKQLDEHLHPLTDISTMQTQITASPKSDKILDINSEGRCGASNDTQRHDGITITKTWSLRS